MSTANESTPGLTLDRVVRAAIGIADAEGLAALSMRRIAAGLGSGAMSLYRYVPGKDELVTLMVDAVFGEIDYPDPPPEGWRARLEASARQEWAMYRRHPWVLPAVATQRPVLGMNVLANAEWALAAVRHLGLDAGTMMQVYLTVSDYVQGTALVFARETEDERGSGLGLEQWWRARNPELRELLASGRFPVLAGLKPDGDSVVGKDFEFGLQRVLDGLAVFLDGAAPDRLSKVTRSAGTELPESTAAAMELLGRRWVPELLYVLCQGDARFSGLARAIPGVSRRVLTERLRDLAEEGLLERRVHPGPPTRISYRLTPDGTALRSTIEHLHAWARARTR